MDPVVTCGGARVGTGAGTVCSGAVGSGGATGARVTGGWVTGAWVTGGWLTAAWVAGGAVATGWAPVAAGRADDEGVGATVVAVVLEAVLPVPLAVALLALVVDPRVVDPATVVVVTGSLGGRRG